MLRKPFDKFIRSIKEFRTPQKLANVWSWFGLINRVSHYVCPILATFKPLVNLKNQFIWNKELVLSFCISKEIIVDAVKKGVEIFDSNWLTCPQPDWSRIDIGFFLSQKNCEWTQRSLGCCENEWKITLAGFQSLRSIETRYAPIKEEALANAWSLEQTQCFTHGCDILQIITDYKTITKLFGNQTLDNIPILSFWESNSKPYFGDFLHNMCQMKTTTFLMPCLFTQESLQKVFPTGKEASKVAFAHILTTSIPWK